MKKRLHDIFSTSRNERVGLIIIAVIVALFIGYTAFAPTKSELPATTQQLANEFQAAVDSSQVDTVKKKRKKRLYFFYTNYKNKRIRYKYYYNKE